MPDAARTPSVPFLVVYQHCISTVKDSHRYGSLQESQTAHTKAATAVLRFADQEEIALDIAQAWILHRVFRLSPEQEGRDPGAAPGHLPPISSVCTSPGFCPQLCSSSIFGKLCGMATGQWRSQGGGMAGPENRQLTGFPIANSPVFKSPKCRIRRQKACKNIVSSAAGDCPDLSFLAPFPHASFLKCLPRAGTACLLPIWPAALYMRIHMPRMPAA